MTNNQFEVWQVGHTAPNEYASILRGRPDGASMILSNTGGLMLILHINAPTPKEEFSAAKQQMECAYYAEGPFWLGQMRFTENKKFCFDFGINILTSKPEERAFRMEKIKTDNVLWVSLVDTHYATVRTIRTASLPPMFHESLYLSLDDQLHYPDFTAKYEKWKQNIYAKYDYNELWRVSTRAGNLGDLPGSWQEKYN